MRNGKQPICADIAHEENAFPNETSLLQRDDGEQKQLFHSVDIEAMTEGEYWMLLKGFVLLQRDASAGRLSAQRAGFG